MPADKFTVTNLSVRFTRHFWPGEAAANTAFVIGTGNSGSASCEPPFANTFPTSHTVFYRWVATLQGVSSGATPLTIMMPLTRFVVGCTQANTDAQLTAAMAANSGNFATTTPHLAGARQQLGYPRPATSSGSDYWQWVHLVALSASHTWRYSSAGWHGRSQRHPRAGGADAPVLRAQTARPRRDKRRLLNRYAGSPFRQRSLNLYRSRLRDGLRPDKPPDSRLRSLQCVVRTRSRIPYE